MVTPDLTLHRNREIHGRRYHYSQLKFHKSGGTGVVYRAHCKNLDRHVAIKFYLPRYFKDQLRMPAEQDKALKELARSFRDEIGMLTSIDHQNIVRIHDHGQLLIKPEELSKHFRFMTRVEFLVSDFVEGDDILNFAIRRTTSKHDIVNILIEISRALIYLGRRKYLHCDIKPENILFDVNRGRAILIDFGLTLNLNPSNFLPDELKKLQVGWDYIPPKPSPSMKSLMLRPHSLKKIRDKCFPWLDIYQFGLLVDKLLENNYIRPKFSEDELKYLRLFIHQCTDATNRSNLNAQWVHGKMRNIVSTHAPFLSVEELVHPSTAQETIQLPGQLMPVSGYVKKILRTRSFGRLSSINELGLMHFLYPGATHTRKLHCLKAFTSCADLMRNLSNSSYFRYWMDENSVRMAMACALLHDINHFPLLHTVQELSRELDTQLDLISLFCDGRATRDDPSIYRLLREVGITPGIFKDLVLEDDHAKFVKCYQERPELHIIRSMLNSGADVDKLAYLEDDSLFSGVSYGHGVDRARLLSSATVVHLPSVDGRDGGWHLGFREDGIPAVESLVEARYWMFRTVYWHRTNRSLMTMCLHVLRKYIKNESNLRDFVLDSMWQSEGEVIARMEKKYGGRGSTILANISGGRSNIYERILAIQGSHEPNDRQGRLYEALKARKGESLEAVRKEFTSRLSIFLEKKEGVSRKALNEDSVLFDIPGRNLAMGSIYISLANGKVEPLERVSTTVRDLAANFDLFTRRIRVYVEPNIGEKIGESGWTHLRAELIDILEDSMHFGQSAVK